jgi:hypothetical protein
MKIAEKKGEKKRYSQPFFFFKVTISELQEQSAMLYLQDWVEIELRDDNDEVIPDKEYTANSSNGAIKKGKTDSTGKIRIEGISPGNCTIQYNLRNNK